MTDNDEKRLKNIEDAVARIERGLFGEEKLEHWGLVARVANQGRRLRNLELLAKGLAAAGFVIGLLYKLAVDWWPKK